MLFHAFMPCLEIGLILTSESKLLLPGIKIIIYFLSYFFLQIRRRRLNSDDPMEGCSKREGVSTRRKTDTKIELGVRLIAQMRVIHNTRRIVALERLVFQVFIPWNFKKFRDMYSKIFHLENMFVKYVPGRVLEMEMRIKLMSGLLTAN